MHLPGHIAITLAQHRLLTLSGQDEIPLAPMLLAGVFPDIVDKSIGYIFCLMPNGRHFTHNIFSLLGLSLVVTLLWGTRAGAAWFLSHLGHLLADGDRVPWFFPAKKYHFYRGRLRLKPGQFVREAVLLIGVFIIYHLTRPLSMIESKGTLREDLAANLLPPLSLRQPKI
jgi:hypothetical protein